MDNSDEKHDKLRYNKKLYDLSYEKYLKTIGYR